MQSQALAASIIVATSICGGGVEAASMKNCSDQPPPRSTFARRPEWFPRPKL